MEIKMKITNCRINHMKNPIGFWMERTVFSWVLEGGIQETAKVYCEPGYRL